jgi:dUTP pyrophosphatase
MTITAHQGVCSFCKNYYKIKPSHYYTRTNPTCSRECSSQVKKLVMVGAGNHQFGLRGEDNSSYKSDLKLTIYGYIKVRVLEHPLRDCDGFVLLHRLVVESHLRENDEASEYLTFVDGCPFSVLNRDYIVHHIDGNKLNNLLNNLEIMSLAEHSRLHKLESPTKRDSITARYCGLQKRQGKKLFKAHKFDAGLDIHAKESGYILANSWAIISTDLFVNVPKNHVGLIWSRSGLSTKYGVHVGAGCVDSGYNGEVKVMLYNHSTTVFYYKKDDRIAQLLTIPINTESYQLVDEFEATERANGGFGSTGV